MTALSLLGFVVRERRAANPLFDLKVLRTRTFTIALIGGTITWVACWGPCSSVSSPQDVLGYSPLRC